MFKNGDKVEWHEGGWGQFICKGIIISEDRDQMGKNRFGHYNISIDENDTHSYHRACHTAYEMHSRTVCRSIELNKLRLQLTD